jgi:hypothetical protein
MIFYRKDISQPEEVIVSLGLKECNAHRWRNMSMPGVLEAIVLCAALGAALAGTYTETAHAASSSSGLQHALAAEVPFLTENNTAMKKMMADMMVEPIGDVDRLHSISARVKCS